MKLLSPLIDLLQDKSIHTAEELAAQLAISIVELNDLLQYAVNCGVPINYVAEQGYHLPVELELLNLKQIQSDLGASALNYFTDFKIYSVIDSTHSHLIEQISRDKAVVGKVCIAEYQTAGKGRHARKWTANFATNVMLSMSWGFSANRKKLAGVSLVVALAIIQSLKEYGVEQTIKIKWPNDIWFMQRKLAGILIDLLKHSVAVISIGLNANYFEPATLSIDQPWTTLQDIVGKPISRNKLIVILLNVLQQKLKIFERQGFAAFSKEWQLYDALYDKAIRLLMPQGEVKGVALGINDQGELRVKTDNNDIKYFSHGEVSVRIDG